MTTISSTASVNEVFWITSLNEDERGLSSGIVEDLAPYLQSIDCPFHNFEPKSATDLLLYFDELASRARAGSRPIIHLDMHGSVEGGLFIAASGESIPWGDVVGKLRAINVQTANNTVVVSGACFSAHLIKSMTIYDATPFYALFAPETEVESGFLETNVVPFYMALFDGGNMDAAHSHIAPTIGLIHSEALLFRVLRGYVKNHCFGKGGRRRLEGLMTRAKAMVHLTGNPLSHWRSFAKKGILLTSELLSETEARFLIGKSVGFTIDQVMTAAKEENWEDQRKLVQQQRLEKQKQKAARLRR